ERAQNLAKPEIVDRRDEEHWRLLARQEEVEFEGRARARHQLDLVAQRGDLVGIALGEARVVDAAQHFGLGLRLFLARPEVQYLAPQQVVHAADRKSVA